ncbi:MAG TPA: HD domain-containing phosphohydrolase [Gaiellaceae bacterium]|nr:HD domain-containing phosphohydrolase [Gaiellaceae bacterium]
MHPRLRTYSYLVGGAFWIALLLRLALEPSLLHGYARIAPLLAIAVAGEELVVRRRGEEDAALSFSAVAHVAAAILLHPTGAAITAALGVLIVDGLRRDGRHFVLVNSAMFGASAWAAAWVFQLLPGHDRPWTLAYVPALLVLILTRYVCTSAIFAGGLAATGAGSFLRLLRVATGEEIAAAAGEGSLGVVVAFGIGENPVLLPFLLPLFGALFASKANFERLRRETRQALNAIVDVIDARDPTTAEHSERVAELVERFAAAIDLPRREAERLVSAARFHDLGKIAVESRTLGSSERLTDDELTQIRMHPRLSAQLLRPFSFARELAEYAALHHERWDGKGYYGVRGEEVPIEAHVLIVADSFDAMTSARPYRPALTTAEAVAELRDKAGTQFHPLVARAFAAVMEGERPAAQLSPDELAELRRRFSPVRATPLPEPALLLQPRLAAMGAIALALVATGVPQVPRPAAAAAAVLALAALLVWAAGERRLRARSRAADAALAEGLGAEVVAGAAGFPGWAAWIAADPAARELEAPEHVPAAAFAEVQAWARLGGDRRPKRLADGSWAVVSDHANREHRLVLGLRRRPRVRELDLLRRVVEGIAAELPLERRRPHPLERGSLSERALLHVRLDAFERLRRGAGQLVSEQVVAEAERRLRATLRSSDAVMRIGDDEFAISTIAAVDELDAIRGRLERALAEIPVPHRLEPIAPAILAAPAAAARTMPELARVEASLFAGLSPGPA